jgi:hypothetical protein
MGSKQLVMEHPCSNLKCIVESIKYCEQLKECYRYSVLEHGDMRVQLSSKPFIKPIIDIVLDK